MKNIKKIILTLLVAISILQMANAQSHTFEWAKQIGGIGQDNGNSVAVDSNGNIYVTGFFQERLTLTLG